MIWIQNLFNPIFCACVLLLHKLHKQGNDFADFSPPMGQINVFYAPGILTLFLPDAWEVYAASCSCWTLSLLWLPGDPEPRRKQSTLPVLRRFETCGASHRSGPPGLILRRHHISPSDTLIWVISRGAEGRAFWRGTSMRKTGEQFNRTLMAIKMSTRWVAMVMSD